MPRLRGFWSADYTLTLLLVSLLLFIFVIYPLRDVGVGGRLLITLLFSCILIAGVGVVAHSALTTVVVGGLVFTDLTLRWLRIWFEGNTSVVVSDTVFSALFCLVLAGVVLAQVIRPGRITAYRIQGAVALYLLLGLAWAFVYEIVNQQWPNAFAPTAAAATPHLDATGRFVYFSFVTLTTVGYGDITAVHPIARSLATMEALTGQLFPAILLARLVAMELHYRLSEKG